jgi:hypothetical protein
MDMLKRRKRNKSDGLEKNNITFYGRREIALHMRNIRSKWLSISKPLRASLFVILFAAIGITILVSTFADNSTGDIPSADNQIVLKYSIGMPHILKENDLPTFMYPAALLYGDGRMLCSDSHQSMSASSAHNTMSQDPPTLLERRLNKREVKKFVSKVKQLGFDQAANKNRSGNRFIEPAASGDHILLNSTRGYELASLYAGESERSFEAIRQYLEDECAKAQAEFQPEELIIESVQVPQSSAVAAPTVPKEFVPTLGGRDRVKQIRLRGDNARRAAAAIDEKVQTYRVDGKAVKVRKTPAVPKFEAPKPARRNKNGTVDAAASKLTRWLWVLPSDSGSGGDIAAVANDVRNFFQARIGKTFDISETTIVRGSKTASQYRTCPTGADCQGYESKAVFYNLQSEFNRSDTSTNIIYDIPVKTGCIGWGGPVAASGGPELVNDTGFAATTTGCNWYDGMRTVAAHENGHSYGLSHTCDNTLMSECSGRPSKFSEIPINGGQIAHLRDKSPFFNAVAAPPPASPRSPSGGNPGGAYYKIRSLYNLKCMDQSPSDKRVLQYNCRSGDPRQLSEVLAREDGGYKLRFKNTGDCVTAPVNQNYRDGDVTHEACVSGARNQLLRRIRMGGDSTGSFYRYQFFHNNLCIQLYSSQNNEGGKIGQQPCGDINTKHQLWYELLREGTAAGSFRVDAAGGPEIVKPPTSNPPPKNTPPSNPPPATGAVMPAGSYGLVAKGKCMDVRGPSTANGAQMQQWTCVNASNQTFSFSKKTDDNYYSIVAKHSGKCVEFNEGSLGNGGIIRQWTCDGGSNQLFRFLSIGGGKYLIQSRASGNRCVDSPYGNNGGILHQWDCNANNVNQQFTLRTQSATPVPPSPGVTGTLMPSGNFTLRVKNKCMDVRGASKADGAQIQQWDCVGVANQSFRFVHKSDRFYNIVSNYSGKCVEFNPSSLRNGGQIRQSTCSNISEQQFKVTSIGYGYHQIAAQVGRCIDSPYSGNGGILHQWDCMRGNNNQAFWIKTL